MTSTLTFDSTERRDLFVFDSDSTRARERWVLSTGAADSTYGVVATAGITASEFCKFYVLPENKMYHTISIEATSADDVNLVFDVMGFPTADNLDVTDAKGGRRSMQVIADFTVNFDPDSSDLVHTISHKVRALGFWVKTKTQAADLLIHVVSYNEGDVWRPGE